MPLLFAKKLQVMHSRHYNTYGWAFVIIIPYQFAVKLEIELRAVPWDIVVIDEAHKLRNAHRTSNRIGQSLKRALNGRKKLLLTEKEMSKAYRASFLGRETEVLLEEPVEIGGARYMVGHTKEYVKAAVPEAGGKNCFVRGVLKEFLTDEIIYLAENPDLG